MGKLINSGLSDAIERSTFHAILARLQEHGRDEEAGERSVPYVAHRYTLNGLLGRSTGFGICLDDLSEFWDTNPLTILRLSFSNYSFPSSLIAHGSASPVGL